MKAMTTARNKLVASLVLVGIMAEPVRANVGTPLIWATCAHLLLGNAIIGIIEGYILARMFKASKERCIVLMIFANYVSGILGFPIVHQIEMHGPAFDIYNVNAAQLAIVVFLWIVTLLIELPFVRISLSKTGKPWKNSVSGSLLIQTVSYTLLVTWYFITSTATLSSGFSPVSPDRLALPDNIALYYISSEDFKIHRLMHGKETIVSSTTLPGRMDYLLGIRKDEKPDTLSLFGVSFGERKKTLIKECIAQCSYTDTHCLQNYPRVEDGIYCNLYGKAIHVGDTEQKWDVFIESMPHAFLNIQNLITSEPFVLSMHSPVLSWETRSPYLLPSDQLVFQLGKDQICLLNLETREISLIARGRGPVVVMNYPDDTRDQTTSQHASTETTTQPHSQSERISKRNPENNPDWLPTD